MKLQAEAEVETLALAGKTIATKMAHWLQLNSLRHQRIIKKRNRMRESQRILLQKALSAAATDIPDNPYVYFPLQYEPERTTNPDGGAFHDQLHTLMILRGFLPDNLSIAVKEHPSQFNASMKGHRGRHPRFYDALRRIKGLHLLPASASSAELLRGCEAVATITGTAGLEGAALGKRSLIFGDAWFRGAPNTVSFTPNLRWADFEATPIVERAELRAWIVSKLRAFVIPGTSGPSNESYFSNWYTDGTLATAENEALYTALEEALTE